MLLLPLLCDLLLLDHDLISALFVALVALLCLQKLVLEVSDLDVALIVELIDSAMENDLESVQFRHGALLFVPKLVNQLSKTLIIVKVTLVFTHVRIQLHFLFLLHDSCLLFLVLQSGSLFLELFNLIIQASDLFFAHLLLLVDGLVVAFILHASILFEGAPLVLKLGDLLSE